MQAAKPRSLDGSLALDGGGIRGLITLGILKKMEASLRENTGKPNLVLGEWFDYIAGTSTGAIIAASLARGFSVDEVIKFYRANGRAMFQSNDLIGRFKSLHVSGPLESELKAAFGVDTTLEPEFLKCLLLVVTRNATTELPWPVSSNPDARYNDPTHTDCNLRLPLWRIVRASAAAPVYFPPEEVPLASTCLRL